MAVLFTPGDLAPAVASRRVRDGRLRRISRGVVTDRSALVGGPLDAGGTRVLYVAHPERQRDLRLPGHVVSVRSGPGRSRATSRSTTTACTSPHRLGR